MSYFLKDFLVGAATAAHQVAGNNTNSNFWAMEQVKPSIFAEPSLDAVDHYNRYKVEMNVSWDMNATGYNVLWGFVADKLYHSYQIFDKKVKISGLVKGRSVYLRVDNFNESGIIEGKSVNL
jgi:beta-glucosidase